MISGTYCYGRNGNCQLPHGREAQKKFESTIQMMGLNMTTAFTVFAIPVVNEGRIPFAIKADPFWCAENQARLRESIAQLELGKVNEHDLIEGGSRTIARN